MARSDAYATTAQSPVKKYLSWSSNEKCFTYWDKEAKENKKLPIPVKFIHYDEMATIKGWHDASGSGIYSNEVKSTKTEPLTVRAFKGGEIATGLYQDIKGKVNASGGDYYVSLYAELGGEVVNFTFKGAALMTWSNFSKENRKQFLGNYINVLSASDEKKGSVKYSVPVFTIGNNIDASTSDLSDKNYDELVAYFKARKANSANASEEAQNHTAEAIFAPVQESPIAAFDEPADSSELPF
jgi:hypothetical protein